VLAISATKMVGLEELKGRNIQLADIIGCILKRREEADLTDPMTVRAGARWSRQRRRGNKDFAARLKFARLGLRQTRRYQRETDHVLQDGDILEFIYSRGGRNEQYAGQKTGTGFRLSLGRMLSAFAVIDDYRSPAPPTPGRWLPGVRSIVVLGFREVQGPWRATIPAWATCVASAPQRVSKTPPGVWRGSWRRRHGLRLCRFHVQSCGDEPGDGRA